MSSLVIVCGRFFAFALFFEAPSISDSILESLHCLRRSGFLDGLNLVALIAQDLQYVLNPLLVFGFL